MVKVALARKDAALVCNPENRVADEHVAGEQ
jgi:hypothetical protein